MVLSPSGPYIPGEGDYQYGQSDRMVTSTINDKKKKGAGVPGKSIEEELCRICGDRASGYHYNALSCEGCKGGWPLSRCCITVYCRFLAIWYKTAASRNSILALYKEFTVWRLKASVEIIVCMNLYKVNFKVKILNFLGRSEWLICWHSSLL